MAKAFRLIDEILALISRRGVASMAQAADSGKLAVLGMGNPLLDISRQVPPEFFQKYGIRLDNAILAEEKHLPMYEEMARMDGTEYIAGGSTLNTIRVAQWMSQTPGFTGYFGSVGKDKFGELMEEKATQDGVKTHFMKLDKVATGTCAVCIQDKERSLVANLSAANEFKATHLAGEVSQQMISDAKIIYSAGFFCTVSPESMLQVAKHCLEKDKVFAINFSAEFIVQVFKDPVLSVLPYTTHVFSNRDEVKAFAKANDIAFEGIADLAAKISLMKCERKQGRTVVVTQGPDSVVVANGGKSQEYPVERLAKDKIVDVNGAGDAFVGGFLSQLATGQGIDKCVQAGAFAARYIIQRSGTKLEGTPDF